MKKKKYLFEDLRPVQILKALGAKYPDLWGYAAQVRAEKVVGKKAWADSCYLPLGAWQSLLMQTMKEYHETDELLQDSFVASALGVWRLSKGYYRYDSELYASLLKAAIPGNAPTDIFFRLPELCVYIETPGYRWNKWDVSGFFAHLSDEPELRRVDLRLVVDTNAGHQMLILPLGAGVLVDALSTLYGRDSGAVLGVISELLSLLLYICSDEPDYSDRTPPARAYPRKIDGREKWHVPVAVKTWDVGVRIGAAIRKYRRDEQERIGAGGTGRTVRPHMRRAHYQGYWTGARNKPDERKFILRWIPQIAVKMLDVAGPVVIRPVKE